MSSQNDCFVLIGNSAYKTGKKLKQSMEHELSIYLIQLVSIRANFETLKSEIINLLQGFNFNTGDQI